jgi:hypothetical protein
LYHFRIRTRLRAYTGSGANGSDRVDVPVEDIFLLQRDQPCVNELLDAVMRVARGEPGPGMWTTLLDWVLLSLLDLDSGKGCFSSAKVMR